MFLVQIGLDIWMAILKVKQCEDTRNRVKAAYYQIAPEVTDITHLFTEVTVHHINLTAVSTFYPLTYL